MALAYPISFDSALWLISENPKVDLRLLEQFCQFASGCGVLRIVPDTCSGKEQHIGFRFGQGLEIHPMRPMWERRLTLDF